MKLRKIISSVIGRRKTSKIDTKLQEQIHKLELNKSFFQIESENKRNFRYPYSEGLPIVIISKKAQKTIDELNRVMSITSQKVHAQKLNSAEHKRLVLSTQDYPIYDIEIGLNNRKTMRISKRDELNGTTPIFTFEITDKDGVQCELIRVSSVDIPECSIKKGQVIKYENRENYFYKKDPLYPRRNFDTIEQQSAGHPLLLKRINSLISNIFKK